MRERPLRPARADRPFGWRDKVGYLLGDFGNDFVFIFASSFLMVFYTNVAGLDPAAVGLIFLIVRVIDAFVDVGWGRFLDTHRASPRGRFRVWIGRMALPLAVVSALLYVPMIGDWAYGVRLAYAGITYLLWGSCFYMMVNISYGSMASVMTEDPAQRSALSVWRSTGASAAGLFVGVVPPLFIYATVDGVSQVHPMNLFLTATAFAGGALVFLLLCYRMTNERVVVAPSAQRRGLGTVLGALSRDKALLTLVLANLVMMIGQFLSQSMAPYLWLNYFNNGQLSSIAAVLGIAPVLLIAPFATRLGRRFGKKEIAIVAGAVATGMHLLTFLLHVTNPWAFLGLTFLGNLGMSLFMLLVWAFITDVIDAIDVKTGSREDGTVYAIVVWARKLGLAAVGGLSGFALAAIGFHAGQATQSHETVAGIYAIATLGPAILFALFTLVMWLLYPLTRARVEANAAALASRRAAPVVVD